MHESNNPNKLAVILIVKATDDEAEHLQRCLESVKDHVDGIFLNINHRAGQKPSKKVIEVAEQFTDNIIVTEWHDNFAEARNTNLAQVPEDYNWVLWLDTDDKVKNPQKIREVIEESKNFDCVYVDYDYDHDDQGNVTTRHMVGRLFKNNGSHHWNPKTSIHETLVETRSAVQGMTRDFKVIHCADSKRTQQSFERNIKMLEQQIEKEQKDPDPRTFYYLASTYMDAGNLEEAKELFEAYLELSGWDQERCVALTKLGRIFLNEGNRAGAKKCFAQGVGEDPANPEPRVELASLEVELEQWNKARIWLEEVEKMEINQTTLEINPLTPTFRTFILLAECYLNMGGKWLDKAEKYAKKALKYKKQDKQVQEYAAMITQLNKDRTHLQVIITKYQKLKNKGKNKQAKKLLSSIPEHLSDNPIVSQLRQAEEPFKWPKKSIAIMTGDTVLDEWGPWSLTDGIGGSEEAIIRLAPKLAKAGYKVVVFAKPGARAGMHDGVMWRSFWDCNLKDEFDIFVGWRNPGLFDRKIKARKSYLWMHDVMEPGEFTEERIANFTKCILLSDYHRSLFPMIPDDKVLLSANGIDPEDFAEERFLSDISVSGTDQVGNPTETDKGEHIGTIERDPHKVFYGSSHVRGLAYLYEVWPKVKEAVPEATLDVYYGRESYDKVHRGNPERIKWMDSMIAKAKSLDGVTDHGRIGQDEIVQRMFESGIWAYPCLWPEIYCITAIKTQAAGCVPVATDFAAINETVQFGTKVHGKPLPSGGGDYSQEFLDEYANKLIWWLKHPEEQEKVRPKMMDWARTKSWQAVADQWRQEFES